MSFWSVRVWFVSALFLTATAALTAQECSNLANLKLPDTTITQAQIVPAGTFVLPPGVPIGPPVDFKTLPAFCRVSATSRPTNDSEIKFEVWLPASNWNGKFEGTGNGGWLGQIIYPALADGLRRGYAAANTDTGHTSGVMDGTWALGHPEKVLDFGYRAVHLMTVRGKDITKAYYGKPPEYSYWNGCSSGASKALRKLSSFLRTTTGL
jgi:feruloyl esterase